MWSHDNVIKFIKTYRKHEILWNPSNQNYSSKILRGHAWREIAQEMGTTEKMVKSKFENISAQLRRERSKMVKHNSKRGVPFTSSWYGFEHMKFLLYKRKYNTNRQTCSENPNENNTSEIQNMQVPQINNVTNESTLNRPTKNIPLKKYFIIKNRSLKKSLDPVNCMRKSTDTGHQQTISLDTDNRKKKTVYSVSSTSNKVKDVLTKSVTDSSASIDADQLYANFIASKFRTYSQQTKNLLQYKISNLLFQADTGVFDNYQAYVTPLQKTRVSRTASRQQRTDEYSTSSSPESKRARRTSSEHSAPITLKIDDNIDAADPLNVERSSYEDSTPITLKIEDNSAVQDHMMHDRDTDSS